MPFILLDLKYYDDLSRLNLGYFYWSPDGRPLSELIMKLLSFGGTLTDLYPYTYIISIFLASYSVYKLAPKEYGVSGVFITSLCFVTWNYIPNAAYRFDNLTMTLSLTMSIIAGTINQSNRSLILISSLLVASLMPIPSIFWCIFVC
ncbi:glucosyltransferase domain-containing protein [Cedecea neteri]|uniref:glucosyltransferase domain-containing protein n=1 Tax=Cedecea neteri TaxID=158822 RepID=UPI0039E614C3